MRFYKFLDVDVEKMFLYKLWLCQNQKSIFEIHLCI